MTGRTIGMTAAAAALAALTACGAQTADSGGDWGDDDDGNGFQDAGAGGTFECFSSSECPVSWTCSELGVCVPPSGPLSDGGAPPPPEVEYDQTGPVSSRRFVWVAMTDQDALAKIDGASLEVAAVAVGDQPEIVATMPGTDTAVVLDRGNGAATVVRPADDRTATERYATLPNLNRLAAAPDGRHAVAFFDLARALAEAGSLDAVGDVGSFQDVTVIALEPGRERAVDLTVGFRPREVEFDAAGRHAFVITDDGVSVIDLEAVTTGAATIVPPVPVLADPFADSTGVEVDVVASGEYAVVRQPGVAGVRVVDLLGDDAGTAWEIALPAAPTDLDLAPDGARVYAVLRDPAALAIIDVPGDAIAEGGVTLIDLAGATSGSLTLSADGRRAVLYTNATLDERITVIALDQADLPRRTLPLQKAVRLVGFAPGGDKLLVVHARAPGSPDDATTVDEFVDRSPGYSVIDVASGFAKLQLTPVDATGFTFAPAAPRAYLILDGGDAEGAVAAAQEVALDTGVVRTIPLGSPPDAVGVLPDAGKIFVSQRHALGRVSFVDIATGQTRTITGFDLNSRVID